MKIPILAALIFLTACAKKSADQAARVTQATGSCQLQRVEPAPQYGADVKLKTYLCSQYSPACFYYVLSSPALDQVPGILSTTCPAQTPGLAQVPPRFN